MKITALVLLLLFPCISLQAQTSGGPDNFGYVWHDSDDPQGPVFNWIDINSLPGVVTVTGLTDDNLSGPYNMPIAFQYYGGIPTQFFVGSNGYIKFLPGAGGIANPFPHIPYPTGANNYIAPFMTDLTFIDMNFDTIPSASCKYWSSPAADTMIITYTGVPFWITSQPGFTGLNTFQVILSAVDQSIVFQYLDQIDVSPLGPTGFIATGIEDQIGYDGLEVRYDTYPLAGTAVRMIPVDVNLIKGNVFTDLNSNGIQDGNDVPIVYHKITETTTSRFRFSGLNGSYGISVMDTGNFQVIPDALINTYFTPVPASHSAYFPTLLLTDSLNDFAYQPNQVVNDLSITITPTSPFRPGFPCGYFITCYNIGTTTLTPHITFYPDQALNYDNAFPSPTNVYPDSMDWNLSPLNPLSTVTILVQLFVDASAPIGSMVNSSAFVEPIVGDITQNNNVAYWEIEVTGAFDPNDILTSRDTILTTELSSPPFIEYIIRFQNTGTDTAFNVRVMNPLPPTLDVSTYEIVETSHPMEFTWFNGIQTAQYLFRNILLPDSNVNEAGSHGFIRYKIKPLSTLTAGTIIRDSAGIFFDFNLPVMTNTALTLIDLPVGIHESTSTENLVVYPNPVHDKLHIRVTGINQEKINVRIFDLPGKLIAERNYTRNKDEKEIIVPMDEFRDGVYFISVLDGERTFVQRIVKIK